MGTSFLRGIRLPGYDNHHSHSSSAKVKNEWSHTAAPHAPSWYRRGKLYLLLFLQDTLSTLYRVKCTLISKRCKGQAVEGSGRVLT
jgi:hypothetical protein